VSFKITNRLKINNDNFKFNNNFKRHIIVEKTQKKTRKTPNISPRRMVKIFFFKRENPFTKIKKSFPTQPKMFSV
jgi:ribosomal protein L35